VTITTSSPQETHCLPAAPSSLHIRNVTSLWLSSGVWRECQGFGGKYCLHFQPGKWRQYTPKKNAYPPRSPRRVTTQNFSNVTEMSLTGRCPLV